MFETFELQYLKKLIEGVVRDFTSPAIPTRVFPVDAVIAFLQSQKVVMHIAQVVKHIAQTLVLRMVTYLIFVGSQRFYQLPVFNPLRVGRQARYLAVTLVMLANW